MIHIIIRFFCCGTSERPDGRFHLSGDDLQFLVIFLLLWGILDYNIGKLYSGIKSLWDRCRKKKERKKVGQGNRLCHAASVNAASRQQKKLKHYLKSEILLWDIT